MPHKTVETVKCSPEELAAALAANTRPLITIPEIPDDLNVLDFIKKETENQRYTPALITMVDVVSWLSPAARKLHNTPVTSTLVELLVNPAGEEFVCETIGLNHGLAGIKGIPQPEGGWYVPPLNTWKSAISIVGSCCKRIVLENGKVKDEDRRRWALALNTLAAKGIWKFGTLCQPIVILLWSDASGVPFYKDNGTVLLKDLMPAVDPRSTTMNFDFPPSQEEMAEMAKTRGQSALLCTYVGLSREHSADPVDAANKAAGFDIFVKEGELGSADWSGFPA